MPMADRTRPRGLIVGAGIAGLTAAIALRQKGIDALVFERADDVADQQVGAGIGLPFNAMRVYRALGLRETIEASGSLHDLYEFRSWRGRLLASWGAPPGDSEVGISRKTLHRLLLDAVEADTLRAQADCTGFTQDADSVAAAFADGSVERGEFLVGADGLHSTIRGELRVPGKLRYGGYTVWRAVTRTAADASREGLFRMLWGRGKRFCYYHVGPGELYWFGVANAPEGERDPIGGRRSKLLGLFADWSEPVERIIAATNEEDIHWTDIYDRKPTQRWGEGRVTLLGDAAHPMTFNLAQGAAQGVEDALELARCLDEVGGMPTGLREYEARRRARTTHFVKQSRKIGRLGMVGNPVLCVARDTVMRFAFDRFVIPDMVKRLAIDV
jgi:2-polyprenyl-6-methoxyphenol hydroxylase-like FAD-dependent oxidoreductase